MMNLTAFAKAAEFPGAWLKYGLLDGPFFVQQAAEFELEYGSSKTKRWNRALALRCLPQLAPYETRREQGGAAARSCTAGFDFLFVYWYLIRFVGESPFSHSALDMKSYAMAVLKTEYRESTKRNMPKQWFDKFPTGTWR